MESIKAQASFVRTWKIYTINNSPIFNIEFRGSLHYVVLNTYTTLIAQASDHQVSSQAPSESMVAKAHFWHASLGHPSRITPTAYIDGHLLSKLPSFQCEPCVLSKSIPSVPHPHDDRSKAAFELIHSDLSGIAPVPTFGGSLYYIAFIDDFTRYAWVYFLKVKSDAGIVIRDFIAMAERQFNAKILSLLTDGGGEYVNYQLPISRELDTSLRHLILTNQMVHWCCRKA